MGNRKAFLLGDDVPNAYGLSGWIFPGNPSEGLFLTTGELYDDRSVDGTAVVSNVFDAVASFELVKVDALPDGTAVALQWTIRANLSPTR